MRITLFIKSDKPTIGRVIDYFKKPLYKVTLYRGKVNDPFPRKAFTESNDILISYLSPWIIPKKVLDKTKFWNINFHPGPPEYPGIGCFNFAIYNKETSYGITAHLMDKKVDTGKIIAIRRFPITKSDSVSDLSMKSYEHMLSLFFEVMNYILEKKELPECSETWKRPPYIRRELEALCKITTNMTKAEIEKRIKATTYPDMPGAYIDIFGHSFEYNPKR